MKIFLFIIISIFHLALGQNECIPTSCGPSAPVVRFPFWLKGRQPEHCGYPGFGLSCNESGRADLDLQFPVTASASNIILPLNMTVAVWNIDYEAQKMLVAYARARSCLPEKLPTVSSSSASPFMAEAIGYGEGHILFNCSNARDYETVACLSNRRHKVLAFASMYDITSLPPYSSCFKMYNISYIPDGALAGREDGYGTPFYLGWSRPSCGKCEGKGDYCRLQNVTAAEETECFSPQHGTTGASKNHNKYLTAGLTAGIILLAFTVIASYFMFKAIKRKIDDKKRIESALKSHKDMRARRYTYADVKKLTNNLKEKLSHGASLHKGKLADGTPVAVKVLHGSDEQTLEDFIDEVEILGRMQHATILQLIGYCIDGRERALIYEFLPGETLETLISSETQNHTLEWEKLQKIVLGIARGVEYVHQESPQKILNLVWNPHSILLDHNFNPKLLIATTSTDEGSLQYNAPELFSTSSNIIPQKANAYGFGMLLLDMVGKSVSSSRGDESGEVHFPEWFYSQLEKREEGKGNELVKKLLIVGLWCMQWFPCDRPTMKAVIKMLQQESMPAIPPNPFDLNVQK